MTKRLLALLVGLQNLIVFAQHNESIVEDKLELVLSEIEKPKPRDWPFIEKLLSILASLNLLYKIIIILLILGLLIFVIYKISSLFLKGKKDTLSKSKKGKISKEDFIENSLNNDYLTQAKKSFLQNEINQAIIFLHLGSIDYLIRQKKLDHRRDYTNREIFDLIAREEFHESFKLLALKAEFVVFKGLVASESDYTKLEDSYKRYFQ